jgi:hypothetical protein
MPQNVRQLRARDGAGDDDGIDGNNELRKIALQVAALLPNNLDEAMRVLDLSRRLVTDFLKS